jgi:hypothetical protein
MRIEDCLHLNFHFPISKLTCSILKLDCFIELGCFTVGIVYSIIKLICRRYSQIFRGLISRLYSLDKSKNSAFFVCFFLARETKKSLEYMCSNIHFLIT